MKTKRLVTDAMLVAMYVVLSLLTIPVGDVRLTLAALPILVGGAIFGPVDGLCIGLLGSFLNQMLTYGFTATTVLWILPAGLRGLTVGWYAAAHKFEMDRRQILFIVLLSAVLVTAMNTLVLYADSRIYGYYSPAVVFGGMLIRAAVGIGTAILLAAVLPPILRFLRGKQLC